MGKCGPQVFILNLHGIFLFLNQNLDPLVWKSAMEPYWPVWKECVVQGSQFPDQIIKGPNIPIASSRVSNFPPVFRPRERGAPKFSIAPSRGPQFPYHVPKKKVLHFSIVSRAFNFAIASSKGTKFPHCIIKVPTNCSRKFGACFHKTTRFRPEG